MLSVVLNYLKVTGAAIDKKVTVPLIEGEIDGNSVGTLHAYTGDPDITGESDGNSEGVSVIDGTGADVGVPPD